jgi:acetyltransferase-like isoleucine patch superfamily enzyme
MVRLLIKRTAQAIALVTVFPAGLLCGFGRVTPMFLAFGHIFAVAPGLIGNFVRAAFYRLTLQSCSQDTTIAFGALFSRSNARVARNVAIGSYSIIGQATIGEGSQISSLVQIPSGKHDHPRDSDGHFLPGVEGKVQIGSYCFIGASAVVLADVGDRSTIGAGSVVTNAIPPDVIAAGNPAKVLRVRDNSTGRDPAWSALPRR